MDVTYTPWMPHSKCVTCRIRLYSAAVPAELVGDLCPACGALLEPVGSLHEVVGYKRVALRDTEPAIPFARAVAAALPRPGQ